MWKIGSPRVLNAARRSTIRATACGLLRRFPAASHSSKARCTSMTMRAGSGEGELLMARNPDKRNGIQMCHARGKFETPFLPRFRTQSVGWAKRKRAHHLACVSNGGHGASAPLPTLPNRAAPLRPQPHGERDHYRARQREPGDGVLHVIVLE